MAGVAAVVGAALALPAARANGDICMIVERPSTGRTTLTCNSLDGVAAGVLHLSVGGADEGAASTYGVAPDGVGRVVVTGADGSVRRETVVHGVYVARGLEQPARIEWEGAGG